MNDKHLIDALAAGHENAYRVFYDRFSGRIFNTALSLLQNRQDAEDITQEVFLEVFRSIKTFRQDAQLQTWVYRVTLSKCADHLKKSKSKKRFSFLTSLFGDDNSLKHDLPHFEHPGLLLENKELGKVLFHALQQLPQKQQMAFTLIKIEGLSYADAASALHTSKSSLESLMFRANENLRVILSDYYKNNYPSGASSLQHFLLML